MKHKDATLAVFPDARIRRHGERFGVFIGDIDPHCMGRFIGAGGSEAEAWQKAAESPEVTGGCAA